MVTWRVMTWKMMTRKMMMWHMWWRGVLQDHRWVSSLSVRQGLCVLWDQVEAGGGGGWPPRWRGSHEETSQPKHHHGSLTFFQWVDFFSGLTLFSVGWLLEGWRFPMCWIGKERPRKGKITYFWVWWLLGAVTDILCACLTIVCYICVVFCFVVQLVGSAPSFPHGVIDPIQVQHPPPLFRNKNEISSGGGAPKMRPSFSYLSMFSLHFFIPSILCSFIPLCLHIFTHIFLCFFKLKLFYSIRPSCLYFLDSYISYFPFFLFSFLPFFPHSSLLIRL